VLNTINHKPNHQIKKQYLLILPQSYTNNKRGVILDTVYFRYRRQEKDGSTPEHNGHTMGEFRNSTFTNDDATTGELVSARKY
jgi:hypothetical protein